LGKDGQWIFATRYPFHLLAHFSRYNNILLRYQGTKKFIFDDEKIKRELDAKKEIPKKKSKFQQRLEDAMRQQQNMKKNKK